MNENTNNKFKKLLIAMIIGIIAIMASSFWLGANTSCVNGGGELSGLRCMELKEIEFCRINDVRITKSDLESYCVDFLDGKKYQSKVYAYE